MALPNHNQPPISGTRVGLLFVLFFLIAGGLGYPILNRYDPRQNPGLSDVRIYADTVTGSEGEGNVGHDTGHVRFRVLIPWMAKQIYRAITRIGPVARQVDWSAQPGSGANQGRTATWDPVMFSLLITDSFFVAATAVLIVVLGARYLADPLVGVIGAFLFLLNFAVPNLRLVGLVDAGEGFFLLALLWSLAETNLWMLLPITILGTLAKETFLPFSMVFGAVWWLVIWRAENSRKSSRASSQRTQPEISAGHAKRIGLFVVTSWAAGVAVFMVLHRAIEGTFTSPVHFALSLHRGHDYLSHFAASLLDHQLWYIFFWLLPMAIPNLKRLPRSWLAATGLTCVVAFALDAYYGGAPGTVGRALFTIAGPVLSLSSALLLVRPLHRLPDAAAS